MIRGSLPISRQERGVTINPMLPDPRVFPLAWSWGRSQNEGGDVLQKRVLEATDGRTTLFPPQCGNQVRVQSNWDGQFTKEESIPLDGNPPPRPHVW